jgi:hypothetical protein
MFKFFTKRWVSRKEYDDLINKHDNLTKKQSDSFDKQISLMEKDCTRRIIEVTSYWEKAIEENNKAERELPIVKQQLRIETDHCHKIQQKYDKLVSENDSKLLGFAIQAERLTHYESIMDSYKTEVRELKQALKIARAKNTRLENKLEERE